LDEAPLVRDLMRAAFAEYLGVLPVESGAHTETVDDVLTVMRRGGAVRAYDAELPVGTARFLSEPDALYVGRVAVLPSHRRQGIASAIMLYLETVARSYEKSRIRIGVRDSLPSNVGLYQALGYDVLSIDPHPRGADRVWTMIKHV
jgi:ribosomal protein S18 acetylase RimI-like enzyme